MKFIKKILQKTFEIKAKLIQCNILFFNLILQNQNQFYNQSCLKLIVITSKL